MYMNEGRFINLKDEQVIDYAVHFVVFFILSTIIGEANIIFWILLSFAWFAMEHVFYDKFITENTPSYITDRLTILFKNKKDYHRDCLEVITIVVINLAGVYMARLI